MPNKVEGHVCRNGYIKPYVPLLCSQCLTSDESVLVYMTQVEIDEWNQRVESGQNVTAIRERGGRMLTQIDAVEFKRYDTATGELMGARIMVDHDVIERGRGKGKKQYARVHIGIPNEEGSSHDWHVYEVERDEFKRFLMVTATML